MRQVWIRLIIKQIQRRGLYYRLHSIMPMFIKRFVTARMASSMGRILSEHITEYNDEVFRIRPRYSNEMDGLNE